MGFLNGFGTACETSSLSGQKSFFCLFIILPVTADRLHSTQRVLWALTSLLTHLNTIHPPVVALSWDLYRAALHNTVVIIFEEDAN